MPNKVTILGCGHGGMALAADLKQQGAKVALWSDQNHAKKFLSILNNQNQIVLIEKNQKKLVELDLVSFDLSEVLNFSQVILNCTPMTAHTALFDRILTYIGRESHIKLLINISGVFSGIDQFLNKPNLSIYNKIKIFDTSTFPYACRTERNNEVSILGRKSELAIAPLFPLDSHYLNLLSSKINTTKLNPIENSFKLGLMGTNAVFHAATILFNARLIDNGVPFLFYPEGISKKTSRLHDALDKERLFLANKMGYQLNSSVEDDNKYYGTNFKNSYEFSLNSYIHKNIQSPNSLHHRFVTEDVAYGLVPLVTLGKIYNIKLLNIESIINIFSTIMGVDYFKEGRNLMSLTKKLIDNVFTKPVTESLFI